MKTKTSGKLSIIALAVVAVVVFVFCRGVVVELVYPAERAGNLFSRKVWTRIRGAFAGASAGAENVRLRREVASLSMVRGDLERLEAENARLRQTLGYAEAKRGEWIAAAVLSEGGAAGVGRTIRVDRGALAGVVEGAVVSVPDGLVGLVTDVTPHTAEITLLTDPSVKVSCRLETGGRKRVLGILSGGGEDYLTLRHLTDAEEVPPRTRVLTSGLGGVFPRGLEVGTLLSITNRMPGVEGEVLPAVDFSTLEDVFIRREK